MTPRERIFAYMRQVRGQFIVGAILTVLYAIFFQLVPVAVRELVGRIEDGLPMEAITETVWFLIAVSTSFAVLRLFSRLLIFRAGREIEFRLRNDLFAHLQRLPQSYFAGQRTGDLMSRAVNDINNVRMFLGAGVLNVVQTPVLYLGAIGVMAWVDPQLTLFVLLPYPLFILAARYFGRLMHAASLATQEQLGTLSAMVQENAAGVFVVRAYTMEEHERERFAAENQALYARQITLAKTSGGMHATITPLPTLAMIIVLAAGGARVLAGSLEQRDLWLFLMYAFQLTHPTFSLGWVINMLQRGLVGLRRLGEILDTVPTIADRPDRVDRDELEGQVVVRDLEFSYPVRQRRPALVGVSFRVEPGQTVGVVGPVGAGKSTLISAIPRLLEIRDGSVQIDGIDVNRLPIQLLRSSIAMVPQDSFLFSTTLLENIRFGRPDASLDEVREAARRAHVLADIEEFPQGFDTLVGERGITLSGGQRQRICLARALLLDPAILILDDALSSVDAATEEAILKELRGARAGRTCFIVAHRISAVRDADFTVVLEEGRVVAIGSHDELLREEGLYARVSRQQTLQSEIEEEIA